MQADEKAKTLNEFCRNNVVSRTMLYRLWRQGLGPEFFLVGNRRRITPEAEREWRMLMKRRAPIAKAS